MKQIQKLDTRQIFNSVKEASQCIDTKMDNWKVQMIILNSIYSHKKAFGSYWKIINK